MPLPGPDDLDPLPVTWQEVIPEAYHDRMEHMNVLWYTHLFGCGVRGFYDRIGLDDAYMQTHRTGVFALEAHIRYLAEVRAGQSVRVLTRAVGRTAKRMHYLEFLVIEETRRLSAICEFVAGHMDLRVRRMAPILEPVASGFDRMVAEHRALPWDPPTCGIMAL